MLKLVIQVCKLEQYTAVDSAFIAANQLQKSIAITRQHKENASFSTCFPPKRKKNKYILIF